MSAKGGPTIRTSHLVAKLNILAGRPHFVDKGISDIHTFWTLSDCLHPEPDGKLMVNANLWENGMALQRFSRVGPRGRGREWATLGIHPLSWLLSNNRLEEVCSTLTKGTFSSRLLLSNQDKGCRPTPSVAHSLPLPLSPALLNLLPYSS